MQVLLGTCGSWYLRQTAKAFLQRDALAGLWISDKNTGVPAEKFRRCWPYHLAIKPFYHCAPQIWKEKAFYALSPVWMKWVRSQFEKKTCQFQVVHAIMGYATEFFDEADKAGALKVIDCANSHPTTLYGFWQRECDLWCPGERVPLPRWIFARMNRELERADMILCPSLFVRDSMVLNGISADKCFVNPFGVDTTVFKKRHQIPTRPRFICVGTICVRKGHQYLFRAFEKVKAILPDAELICVGNYKRDFRLEQARWDGTFVRHEENLSHTDLAKLLQTGTAFVLASVEEGFARVISEAMGAGLPIVATHESGATTQVADGNEGCIVPARSPDALADAMIRIASDLPLNERMGEAAYKRGAEQNTWQHYGDRLLAEYQRRISKKSDRRPVN